MNNHQWRVTWYEQGEDDVMEMFDRFADAWAISQPAAEPGVDWRYTLRDQVSARFIQGEQSIIVAWTDDMLQRVVIEKM